jgi:CRISPR/Cas system-associated exonuclease Cas4 (RecB family)
MPLRLITSPSASERVDAAREWMRSQPLAAAVLIVGATRAAADELALSLARDRGALFGVTRMAFAELAMKLALPVLARQQRTPGGALGSEAIATRVAFEANAAGELGYFGPVADLPGFPRAATRTLSDLQLAGVARDALSALDQAGSDLAVLLQRADDEASRAGAVTRAELLACAAQRLRESPAALGATDIVLLDVAIANAAEEGLLAAILMSATHVLATVPDGDRQTQNAYAALGLHASAARADVDAPNALLRLQSFLFSTDAPPAGDSDDSVHVFSAPGEGREAVEIARRVLSEADRGVPFDEMGVLLRAPQTYFGLLEHAFARAGVPVWFERGTRRPDPAGRALLALLACADESLSARRFAEYLSLAQVPALKSETPTSAPPSLPQRRGGSRAAPTADKQLSLWDAPTDDVASAIVPPEQRPEDPEPVEEAPTIGERDGDRIVAGTLRAPWRWEELLVEAYVIQGIDRWRRRLPGLAREYQRRLRELDDEDHDSPRVRALARDIEELTHLESFALPIVGTLDAWQAPRTWGEWLHQIGALVPRVLRQPARVLRVLGEMAPLGSVGPVTLREVREVLAPRLLTLTHEPSRRRAGRVFVGTPHSARGRLFRIVFVPGLAERIFPQRLREDALLLDTRRTRLHAGLTTAEDRADGERLQLRLAVGAASQRVYLSYPRLELGESRPRVPSFYVLDVMRATTGAIPRYKALSEHAFSTGGASLAWPAPPDPAQAIDDMEHDLAVLRPLLRASQRHTVEGRARYLLELNPALRRSVTERWLRWQSKWSQADGLIRVQAQTAEPLTRQRLTTRPYSLTALQRYSTCPYQFQLAAMYQLAPLEEPTPLQRLDPLTRGSLFHEIQTELFRKLQTNSMLPVTESRLSAARGVLDWAVAHVTTKAYDDLAPAIDRVWKDEIAGLTRDLRVWLERLARDGQRWVPERFELAFGLPPDINRDPASTREPARVGPGFLLRGSIDLVERRADGRALRVTDHKTGRNRTTHATIVDGGRVLQPVLYGVALEAMTGETVEEGRLSFCTTQGQFSEHPITLDPLIRRRGIEVLEIIDRAIEHGMLAAYPARDACKYCDFRPVCGPDEERRTHRKPGMADLDALRKMS